ncbi:MAG TPA: EGF domain-containing protein, partial [Polyangiaceae bacterium]|nr:EGF domain-containing protein [Polyangiaceae bacterium]
CVDEPIGYRCECLAGYSGDGVECTDVDECETGADACAADAACTNTPGGYTCACAAGFAGDGVTCADLDECETGADDCSADATCTNLPGSYACACNAGFTGDGVTCADVDECDLGTDNCSEDATCANTAGSFTCTCDPGFAGNGVICSASCGDGLTTDPEECDDANEQAADGCSTCVLDPGFRCVGTPSVCASVCGDGLVVGDEDCDDGNSAELDGCTTACALECGDGAVNGLEAVTIEYLAADCFGLLLAVNGRDPIALPPGGCEDLCSPTIQTVEVTEPAFLSSFRHGDNTLAVTSYLTTLFGEEVYDYICAVEPQFCTYVGWVTLTARYRDIGSELVVAYDYEDGEDAELRNPDLCDAGAGIDAASTFPLPFIGVAGETCDDGNRESADGCSATCATECGNGVIDDAEQCDDGNGVSGDGCSASCFVEEMWSCRLQPSQCEIRPEYLTCQDRCGDLFGGACWCAPPCTEFGNCCDDFAEICGGDV